MNKYKFSKKSKLMMQGVHPDLIAVFMEAIEISPIDFGIPKYGGLRTAEEQALLYADGKSKCDGYTNISKHQKGKALDVFAYVDGKASWDEVHLAIIAGVILSTAKSMGVELEWGGFWCSFKDMPHFQIID